MFHAPGLKREKMTAQQYKKRISEVIKWITIMRVLMTQSGLVIMVVEKPAPTAPAIWTILESIGIPRHMKI
jgi:hypothetical protein